MNVVIPTIGSRGDVQPFIALAQGLQNAGHEVVLLSHPMMQNLVESHGVRFVPIGPDINMVVLAGEILARPSSMPVNLMRVMRLSFDVLEQSHPDILEGCRDADLVVVPTISAAGRNEADLLNKPSLSVTFNPDSIPTYDPERPLLTRILYAGIDWGVRLVTIKPLNRLRRQQGLPPVDQEGVMSDRLDLVPISPVVYPPRPQWKPHHHVTGYWFIRETEDWEPPGNLLSFLESGKPPIVISLGAMSLGQAGAQETATLFVEAVQQAGVRAIMQGWGEALGRIVLPPSIHAAGIVPHSWLLARAAAVVHHGGFGTTSAGLRAGIPVLVIPHLADQFYWGGMIKNLGAGPAPISRSKLKVDILASSLKELVENESYRAASSRLGEQIRAEDGVAEAVRMVEAEFAV